MSTNIYIFSLYNLSVLKKKFEELFHLLLDVNPSRRGLRKTDTGNTRSWKDCVDEIENTQVF